jgi:hypothetical protein
MKPSPHPRPLRERREIDRKNRPIVTHAQATIDSSRAAETAHPLEAPEPAIGARHTCVSASQLHPAAQSSVVAHDVAHAPETQKYGAHELVVPSEPTTSVPSLEHVPARRRHRPSDAHRYPTTQSLDETHDVRHAVPAPLHANPLQLEVTAVGHAPVALHDAGSVATPSLHAASRQPTSAPTNCLHVVASFPSQSVAVHGSAPGFAHARAPCGVPPMVVHVPAAPATSHASHAPLHARSQHRPSTHRPVPHSASTAHVDPCNFRQSPFAASVAHELPDAHDADAQHTLETQNNPTPQSSSFAHASPFPATGSHVGAAHANPGAQSVFVAQLVLHAIDPHA